MATKKPIVTKKTKSSEVIKFALDSSLLTQLDAYVKLSSTTRNAVLSTALKRLLAQDVVWLNHVAEAKELAASSKAKRKQLSVDDLPSIPDSDLEDDLPSIPDSDLEDDLPSIPDSPLEDDLPSIPCSQPDDSNVLHNRRTFAPFDSTKYKQQNIF